VTDRRLKNGDSSLSYQLYRDAAHTQVFGDIDASTNIHYTALIPANTTTTYDTGITLYGHLPGGQTPTSTGMHQSIFNPAYVSIKWASHSAQHAFSGCASLDQTMSSGSFTVQTLVQPACTAAVLAHVNFAVHSTPGVKASQGRIQVQCDTQTAYKIEMQDGLYAMDSGSPNAIRRMRHSDQPNRYVAYDLYRNAQATLRWGRIANNQSLEGNGTNELHTVYARAMVPTDVTAGDYSDTVVVLLEY